jgi:hypothetical protein
MKNEEIMDIALVDGRLPITFESGSTFGGSAPDLLAGLVLRETDSREAPALVDDEA